MEVWGGGKEGWTSMWWKGCEDSEVRRVVARGRVSLMGKMGNFFFFLSCLFF